MPRIAPITGKSDVPAAHHGVVDAVVKVFSSVPTQCATAAARRRCCP
jgi:hypothetical protein